MESLHHWGCDVGATFSKSFAFPSDLAFQPKKCVLKNSRLIESGWTGAKLRQKKGRS
jgi:hypothetical protein